MISLKSRPFSLSRRTSGTMHRSNSTSPREPNSAELHSPKMSPKNRVDVLKLQQLGSGGSGAEVWRVSIDDWICCAKIIEISASNLSDVEAFEKEIEILKDLPSHHQHIARYLGYQRSEGKLELFMSLYDGSIFDLIVSRRPLKFDFRRILEISECVLSALVTLHSRKLIHRDVKSANVFYQALEGGRFKFVLGDFGQSKIMLKKKTTTVSGTSRWIAPEIFKNQCGYSHEADMWSFGMFLYELIALQIPFHDVGLGVEEVIVQGKCPQLTPEECFEYPMLTHLYSGCAAANPDERWTAMRALSHVKELLQDHPDPKRFGDGGYDDDGWNVSYDLQTYGVCLIDDDEWNVSYGWNDVCWIYAWTNDDDGWNDACWNAWTNDDDETNDACWNAWTNVWTIYDETNDVCWNAWTIYDE